MTRGEKVILLLAVVVVGYIGISMVTTGKPISNPTEWFKLKYRVSFYLDLGPALHRVFIKDLDVTRAGTVPGLKTKPLCFLPGGKEVTTKVTVEKPNGVSKLIMEDSSTICIRGHYHKKATFVADGSGTYTITVKVIGKEGKILAKKTITPYLKGKVRR